ncbi:pimeloyl-ACP methyl ester carboxylesterase [Actinocrispum wychmicini]|uniref:Pimeloyl-ACP methyl ester carboxylesterase n=1 Tax=Actinocrispum wychmicini TaxID=1213861 RepID=A0A4R2IRG1_9PSEU|nr:pimeloyl-ACP methyl ester carboxylesterase [Actinocrispum wychmicini]
MGATQFLERPDGRLAYDIRGQGPLVLCSPGLGNLRGTFDDLVEPLVAAGFTVATVDLRGHGESTSHWPSYNETDVACDLVDLIEALGVGPAVLLGNSFSAAAAVVAAADNPGLVTGLVLTGPYLREQPKTLVGAFGRWVITRPAIGRWAWNRYWPRLFGPRKPADLATRVRTVSVNLAEPGRYDAVRAMLSASHHTADQALPDITCPTLVVMGDADPCFADPEGEAWYAAERTDGLAEVLMVRGAGHYPHAECPQCVSSTVVRFLRSACFGEKPTIG